MEPYWGHSKNNAGQRELLKEHLANVAHLASGFAQPLGQQDAASAAGWLHDLGKYAEQFQSRVRGGKTRGRDHSTAGALLALHLYHQGGIGAALAIEGHHVGLKKMPLRNDGWKEWANELATLLQADENKKKEEEKQYTSGNLTDLWQRMQQDGVILATFKPRSTVNMNMLDVRMLFSALVDADFLATEAHFETRPRLAGSVLEPQIALQAVLDYINIKREQTPGAPGIQSTREWLLKDCLDAAELPPGLFTLSAPTGSGKTLAMLAFALKHAQVHGLRRIVTVMPFLNIIDQTAQEYHKVFSSVHGFPENFVIEDHSHADLRDEIDPQEDQNNSDRNHPANWQRLLAENWDAPIILTTSVKCLESLHAHRPGACRKLHRLARSVILFDEVQTLPLELAAITLTTLSQLAQRYGSTILFATATQPAFGELQPQVKELSDNNCDWRPREIVSNPEKLFVPASQRIRVHWPEEWPLSWPELAKQLASPDVKQSLTIVNLKRHAQTLLEELQKQGAGDLFHLSTTLCPAHRHRMLQEVRQRLLADQPVRLVATQCVEAGVDLDFPRVYRALGPLESIAQAAGRCNRHGQRLQPGEVFVFKPERKSSEEEKSLYPTAAYGQAASVAQMLLKRWNEQDPDGEILNAPDRLQTYYRRLYKIRGKTQRQKQLEEAWDAGDFKRLAQQYQLIPTTSINILIPFDRAIFDRLVHEITQTPSFTLAFVRDWIRRARPYCVSVLRPSPGHPCWNHLQPVQFSPDPRRQKDIDAADWFICLDPQNYDTNLLGYRPNTEFNGVI